MKTAVIYWSGTGNTEAMAKAVAEGAGAECFAVSEFSGNVEDYDAIALGCPAMGAEELEDSEFEPFFAGIEGKLSGKKIALFGSYGWGDGEWMRQWQDRVTGDGATLVNGEGLIVNETPDDDALASCKALGCIFALHFEFFLFQFHHTADKRTCGILVAVSADAPLLCLLRGTFQKDG